nr:ascorbate transporter, chloroplastic-like [Ipomoea batatas]
MTQDLVVLPHSIRRDQMHSGLTPSLSAVYCPTRRLAFFSRTHSDLTPSPSSVARWSCCLAVRPLSNSLVVTSLVVCRLQLCLSISGCHSSATLPREADHLHLLSTYYNQIMQSIGFLGPAFFLNQLSNVNTPALAVTCMACSQVFAAGSVTIYV